MRLSQSRLVATAEMTSPICASFNPISTVHFQTLPSNTGSAVVHAANSDEVLPPVMVRRTFNPKQGQD